MTDLLDFFPANRRTNTELSAHFKSAKLDNVADLYQKQRSTEIYKETLVHLKELINGSESNEEVSVYMLMMK